MTSLQISLLQGERLQALLPFPAREGVGGLGLYWTQPKTAIIIQAMDRESPQVQIQAHSLLIPLSEQKVK